MTNTTTRPMNRRERRLAMRGQQAQPIAPATVNQPTWEAETEEKAIFLPTGKFRANGNPILRRVTIRSVIISKDLVAMKFTVTHITRTLGRGRDAVTTRTTTICDHREEATGATGTKGIWGTREGQKAGRAKSLTPSAWVTEVTRFIGEARAKQVLRELGTEI